LVISYKGWGEKSYAKLYKNLGSKKAKEVSIILIKRKLWEKIRNNNFALDF